MTSRRTSRWLTPASGIGEECAAALAGRHVDSAVVVKEVLFTATTADSFTVLRRFPLNVAATEDHLPGKPE